MRGHPKRPEPRKPKKPHSPNRTKLWHVYFVWEGGTPLIIVAEVEQKFNYFKHMRIRSITGRAAARIYIRNNLAFDITAADQETDNPMSPTFGSRPRNELVKKRDHYQAKATIHVIKKGKE